MKRALLAAVLLFGLGGCVLAQAQPDPEREKLFAGIRKTYPHLPETLAGYLADDGMELSRESRCELVDWFAAGREGVPEPVIEQARLFSSACTLSLDGLTPERAAARLGDKPLAMHVDGETVTIVARAESAPPYVCCSPQVTLQKLGDGPFWARRLRLKELDRAMLTFLLMDPQSTDPKRDFEGRVIWRGPHAPEAPPVVGFEGMKGTLKDFEIDSVALGERRKLAVYLPPGWTKDKTWPAAFIGDGAASSFMLMVEKMISLGQIKPIVLIGVGSGAEGIVGADAALLQKHADLRAADYLPDWKGAGDRFDRHLAFVADEVTAWATLELNVSMRREDRLVTGFSNGGVFALYAAVRRPDVFGFSVPMSPCWHGPAMEQLKPGPRAKFRISGGLYEPDCRDGAVHSAGTLKAAGYDVVLKEPAAGHFHDAWSLMLSEALREFFPAG